jgi:hypothetical protein
LILCTFSILLVSFTAVFAETQGFTITSVSLSKIVQKGQPLTDTWWTINTVWNGGVNSILGTITPDQTKGLAANGYTTQYPITISGGTVSQSAKYGIQNSQRQTIYTYTVSSTSGTPQYFGIPPLAVLTGYSTPSECPQGGTIWSIPVWIRTKWIPFVNSDMLVGRVCIQQNIAGNEASLALNAVSFKARMTATVNGQTTNTDICSGTMDNGQPCQTSVQFDNGKIRAQWTGNLVTGNYPPEAKDYVAIWKIREPYWRIASFNTYNGGSDSYVQKQNLAYSTFQTLVSDSTKDYRFAPCNLDNAPTSAQNSAEAYGTWRIDCITNYVNNMVSPVNVISNSLLTSTFQITSGQKYVQDSGSPDSGEGHFEVPLQQNFVSNPNILFTVAADWIGVVIPQGKPSIEGVVLEGGSFDSGNTGVLDIVVKNVGDAADNFVAGLSSCQGVTNVYNQGSGTAIEPGYKQTIKVYIQSTGGAKTLDQDCTVKVTAQNSAESATASVRVKMTTPVTCDEGKTYYSGTGYVYEQCVNGQKVQHQCQYGVISDNNGGWMCASPPSSSNQQSDIVVNPSSSLSANPMTGNWLLSNPIMTGGIVGAVVIAITLLVLWKKNKLHFPSKKKEVVEESKSESKKEKKKSKGNFCTGCGSKLKEGQKFCTGCGKKMI